MNYYGTMNPSTTIKKYIFVKDCELLLNINELLRSQAVEEYHLKKDLINIFSLDSL